MQSPSKAGFRGCMTRAFELTQPRRDFWYDHVPGLSGSAKFNYTERKQKEGSESCKMRLVRKLLARKWA